MKRLLPNNRLITSLATLGLGLQLDLVFGGHEPERNSP